jgi:ribosomal protein S12 methylthiotransferase
VKETYNKIHLVSLGCARNLVDSEFMLGRLKEAGYEISPDPESAHVIIINTCSFISSAVDESIDTVLELARNKTSGNCGRLIVTGCLPERFREEITESMPEVDFFLGTGAYHRIVDAVENRTGENRFPCLLPNPEIAPHQAGDTPRVRTSPYTAYVKIAEGCNKKCTFCMIPKLRGGLRSRSGDDIEEEVLLLKESGVQEITLVAQDTTCYGLDLVPPTGLGLLLERLAVAAGKY